jgi:pepF/M3 family oligoendopeptidase
MDTRWDLTPLYRSFESPEYLSDLAAMKTAIADIDGWAKQNLTNPAANAAQTIETYIGKINGFSKYYNLYYFAYLTAAVETAHETANKQVEQLRALFTDLTEASVLFAKFAALCDIDEILKQSETNALHGYIIRKASESAKYMLAEHVEVALSKIKTTASAAWGVMKENLTASMMIQTTIDGETKRLPLSTIRNLAHDANPATRKAAYEAEIDAYATVEKPVAAALNAIKGEVLTESKMRGYESPLHMTLIYSRMTQKTLDALISSIEKSLPCLRRFYEKKARLLGHEKYLPYYDLFAPIGENTRRFTFEEAAEYIVGCFSGFSPRMGDFAKQAFDGGWLDIEPREGKRGGAFCLNIHSLRQSRVMSNFTGSFSDVATLAHELGHAYHGHCLRDETYLNSSYPMPIAETASTFCETLVFDAALKTAPDGGKLAVLEAQITDATQVIVDIYARYVFETNLFKQRENGPLSVKELNALMTAAQAAAYGDTLDPDTPHPYMWLNKPHYYYPNRNFYNFPYAYGLMFALGLYSEYRRTGAAFPPKYDGLLRVTGRKTLEDIGREAGIDVTDEGFWLSSLRIIEEKVDEFCAY